MQQLNWNLIGHDFYEARLDYRLKFSAWTNNPPTDKEYHVRVRNADGEIMFEDGPFANGEKAREALQTWGDNQDHLVLSGYFAQDEE